MIVAPIGFQFTPLREGRRAGKSQTACGLHFNSRPSARGDQVHAGTKHEKTISIHAPPRGATRVFAVRAMVDAISIHAPPRGATSHCHYNTGKKGNFNSRPSARGDAGGSGWPPAGSAISIHAPPRGATVHRRSSRKPSGDFNSRPSARGDKCINHTVSVEHISIHAPPRGATAGCITVVAVSSNFNSRPSARGDRHSSNFA